jgi:hypothetical protein
MRKLRRLTLVLLLAACGSRTGLPIDDSSLIGSIDTDAGNNNNGKKDGSTADVDAGDLDALPGLDVTPTPDVVRNDCPDAAATLIYVVSETNELYSFFPTDGTFTLIGNLTCPAPAGDTPFSMAVNRTGIAYVVFSPSGNLYRVSTATAACAPTPYHSGQAGFSTYGMGFSTDFLGPTETLYVAGDSNGSLASINTTNFALSLIGPFNPAIDGAELTGTGDGRLYAFYAKGTLQNPGPMYIGEIDKAKANVVAETLLPGVDRGGGWAFGYWGGDFYTFTAPAGQGTPTTVQRFRPSDGSVTTVANIPQTIVGAGVSTCAPQQ